MNKKVFKLGCISIISIIIIATIILAIVFYNVGKKYEDDQKEKANNVVNNIKEKASDIATEAKKEKEHNKTEAKEKKETQEPKTLEQKITDQINNKLGKKSNTDKKRIVKLEINDHAGTEKSGDKIILITLSGDENITTKFTRKGMLMKSEDAFKEIFSNKEVEEVTLFWQYPLVDNYGKESDSNVMKIGLTKATYNKINWNNFDYNNFESVSDQYWTHPAIRK